MRSKPIAASVLALTAFILIFTPETVNAQGLGFMYDGHTNTSLWPLKVKTFLGFPAANVTDADVDAAMLAAFNAAITDEGPPNVLPEEDMSCNVNFTRSLPVTTFTTGDGDVSDADEISALGWGTDGFLKIVNAVSYCSDRLGSYAGCTEQGNRKWMILAEAPLRSPAGGVLLLHEFGHAANIDHTPGTIDYFSVWRENISADNTHIYDFRSENNPNSWTYCDLLRWDYLDADGPMGSDPLIDNPPGQRLAPSQSIVEPVRALKKAPEHRPIEQLARSFFADTIPVEVADGYGREDLRKLWAMLRDENLNLYHGTILLLIGLISDGSREDTEQLVAYAEQGSTNWHAWSASVIGLGYMANHGSAHAIRSLIRLSARTASGPLTDWSVSALALSGRPEAVQHLQKLSEESQLRSDATSRAVKAHSHLSLALREHARVSANGLKAYYGR